MIEKVHNEESIVRSTAVRNLGKLGDKRAINHLIDFLKDDSIKWETIGALVELVDEEHIDLLLESMKSENQALRRGAARVLDELGDERGVRELLKDDNPDLWDYVEGLYYSGRLSKLDEPETLRLFIKAGAKLHYYDEKEVIPKKFIPSLGTKVVDLLIQSLNDKNQGVRYIAVMSLAELRNKKAIPEIIKSLHDEDKYVRAYALVALEDLEGLEELTNKRDAIQIVTIMGEDYWAIFRGENRYDILFKIGKTSTEALFKALDSDDSFTSEAAEAVLRDFWGIFD